MWYVYILYDKISDCCYAGLTQNLKRRYQEHKNGNTHTTVRFVEKELIFYEAFICERDARRREQYFKTTKGKRALRLMLQETFKVKTCPVV